MVAPETGTLSLTLPVDQTAPHTVATLAAGLRALGLAAGDVVLVHASTRGVGFVAGGPQAIVEASPTRASWLAQPGVPPLGDGAAWPLPRRTR
jgi:hypothetical protein